MRMGQGVRTSLGHGGITCVLLSHFSSSIHVSFVKCKYCSLVFFFFFFFFVDFRPLMKPKSESA